MTLYELFQVSETASQEEIRASYVALAKKFHPDLHRDDPEEAEKIMKTINAAYEILSDPIQRKQYDGLLREEREKQRASYNQRTTYQTSYARPTTTYAEQKKDNSVNISIVVIITCCVLCVFAITSALSSSNTNKSTVTDYANKFTETEPSLQPVTQPKNGEILEGWEDYYGSELTVTASNHPCTVRVKDEYGNTEVEFYVRANSTATVGVPAKNLYVYFASGPTWYGTEHYFGDTVAYSKDDEPQDFYNYSWEYTLTPVTYGNFDETPIDAEEYFD
ncbi:MAG: J domain-containing protein [Ruminococcaceae bacterium]|nr:J domain-containing protein [Oscillospiraceae bacterium]